jgi:hypothetical protein
MGSVKRLTREQVQSRKDKAVRFVRDVLDDPDRAEEIDHESVRDYSSRRGFTITNPKSQECALPSAKAEVTELEGVLGEVQDLLEEAYAPEATREELAEAIGNALDVIEGEGEEEAEEEQGER